MIRKLKSNKGIQGLIPAIASLLIFFFVAIVYTLSLAFAVLGSLMILYSLAFGFWQFVKTNNYYFLITAFYLLTLGLVFQLIDMPDSINGPKPEFGNEFKLALLFFYFFMFWLMYISYRKKLKFRGCEIMELAARDVDKAPDSYTERPRPAGVTELSKYDILDFASYLKRNLVCMPFEEENRVLLVPIKQGNEFEFLYKPNFNYLSKTWISFAFDGQVSVHISRADYLDFKDDLSFDHLCQSLGELMISFSEFYAKGDKVRIMDRVNSVKTGLFSQL